MVKIFDWDRAAELIVKYQPNIASIGLKTDIGEMLTIYEDGNRQSPSRVPSWFVYGTEKYNPLIQFTKTLPQTVECWKEKISSANVIWWPDSAVAILKAGKIRAPSNISSLVINDHTCISCGNTRCSKTKKSCWKCGNKI